MPKGADTAGSPTAEDVKPKDSAQVASSVPESSPGNDEHAAPSAEPQVNPGEGAAETPAAAAIEDPLEKLRQSKVSLPGNDPATDETPAGEEPAAEGHEPKATDDKPAGEQPAATVDDAGTKPTKPATDSAAKPVDPADDPLVGFDPAQRKALGQKATSRIVELNTNLKSERQQRKAEEPLVKGGRWLQQYVGREDEPGKLAPNEVAAALEFGKLYKSKDPRALQALEESLAELRQDLGIEPEQATAELEPFDGELPASLASLVDLDPKLEKEVRLIAALRQRESERAKAAKAGTRQQAPAQRQQPPANRQPAPQQRQQAPPQPQRSRWGYSREAEAGAADAVTDYLKAQKVPDAEIETYFVQHIAPKLAKNAQNGDITSIDPVERLRLVQIAHQRVVLERAEQARQRRTQPQPVGGSTSPGPRSQPASRPGSDPLADLRRRKVG